MKSAVTYKTSCFKIKNNGYKKVKKFYKAGLKITFVAMAATTFFSKSSNAQGLVLQFASDAEQIKCIKENVLITNPLFIEHQTWPRISASVTNLLSFPISGWVVDIAIKQPGRAIALHREQKPVEISGGIEAGETVEVEFLGPLSAQGRKATEVEVSIDIIDIMDADGRWVATEDPSIQMTFGKSEQSACR